MTARSFLQLASVALLSVSAKDYPAIDAGDCDCFRTDGASEAYFTNHLFFDFRSLSQHAGIPDLIDNENDTASAEVTSDYFSLDKWTKQWTIQSWNNSDTMGKDGSDATVLLVNSPNNVYIQANDDDDNTESSASDTYLTMRTSRLESFQSAAEMESASDSYHFLSVRMYARTIGSSGACTAVFTYRDGVTALADVQEADIEFLTAGPRDRVQYTNQPSFTVEGDEVKDATFNETLPLPMGEWAVHRMDWTPENTVWYVDGEEVKRSSFQVPKDPSRVLFNAWSDGGSWSGEMDEGEEAFLQIQWIEMIYNSTDTGDNDARKIKRDEEQCDVVCSIDEADEVGGAVKLSGAAAPFGAGSMKPMMALWIASIAVGYL